MNQAPARQDDDLMVRVCYADTDAGGVVYHASYLRYFDQARAEWLAHRGLSQAQARQQLGLVLAVQAVQLRYRRPAGLDARLRLCTRAEPLRPSTLRFHQQAWRDDELLVEGELDLVCVDVALWKSTAWPSTILDRLDPQR